ncbi:Vps62-related protein [Leptolyngbya sp. PL-A3]|uniref:Vps62-related protein n=1 Tax=Leptolyngbya sp. PL-A3 TaxID=2933911 RepID=UPI0032970E9F
MSSSESRHGKAVQFGDLILQFTSQYEYRWNTIGGDAYAHSAFYHPIPPEGFYPLGSIGRSNLDDPNGKCVSICVKSVTEHSSKPALREPEDYELVWNDRKSNAASNGACWRPKPPDGYVALGDVFSSGYEKPKKLDVMCVAIELAAEGCISKSSIWTTDGSNALCFSAWQIIASEAYLRDTSDGLFEVNSFTGSTKPDFAAPNSSPVAYTLRLPMPTEVVEAEIIKPKLSSRTRPAGRTAQVVDRIVTVPFTAILDPDKDLNWQLEHSPFYDIERSVSYKLLIFEDNGTEVDQTQTLVTSTGITTESSRTFSLTTGISVSYESGIELGIGSSKVTAQLSIDLGYSSTTSVSTFDLREEDVELTIPANHAAAVWSEVNTIRLWRSDNTPVGPLLEFERGNTAFLTSQYPAPKAGTAIRYRRIRRKLR